MANDEAYEQRRRELLERVLARRHELASSLVDEYRTAVAEYRELPEAVLVRDVGDAAVQNIEYLVDTFDDGFDIPEEEVEWLRRSAARRVHQQISLPSLLRTYRLWGNRLWREMVAAAGADDLGRQLAIESADAMMRYIDIVSAGVTQAYLTESSAAALDKHAIRTDVLETLLTDKIVSERARRQVAVLAASLRNPLLVVVIQLPERDNPLRGAQGAVRAARNQLREHTRNLYIGVREAEVVCICELDHDHDGSDGIDGVAHALADCGRGWTVGIGRLTRGLPGVRRSYAEAHEAAELGFSLRQSGRAVRFTDVLLDQILRSTTHVDALLEETVGPLLAYDDDRGSAMLATLRSFVRSNFNLTKAAAELTVNPNTVVYRLRRIRALTGRDPAAVDDLLLLALGLRLYDSAPKT